MSEAADFGPLRKPERLVRGGNRSSPKPRDCHAAPLTRDDEHESTSPRGTRQPLSGCVVPVGAAHP